MNNIFLDARTIRDIDKVVDRVHLELGYKDGAIDLRDVREALRLDLKYYRLDDPGLLDEVVHKLTVGAKQVIARPGLLVEAVRTFNLSALFLPDRKRIFVDQSVPELKKRWYETHEIAHSLIPWHADYTLGDNRSTLSQGCHERIEAEANYGGGRLLFPNEAFTHCRLSGPMSVGRVREIAKHFGNTITSTLWRCVEQSDELMFAAIGEHPRRPRDGKPVVEYFIRSKTFETQFPGVTDMDVWNWMSGYCVGKTTGPLGTTEIPVQDRNGQSHIFLIESFGNGYNALTMARWLRKAPAIVSVGGLTAPLLIAPLAGQ
ncbi:ImmA/IrrE family metallo-endopeptidase [Acidovorax radicis]|uniref:ImmA/IrrE family metallo-endopeptidase n=1 Tax=Acidovorax radicis TaxID=758826 RepID=UPI0002377F6F|nr:ImmA/IrrE family metallo-endopeptidase [Acidovorax radicis]